MRNALCLLLAGLTLAACAKTGSDEQTTAPAPGGCADAGGPTVTDAWVRAAPAGQGSTAAYFTVCNGGDAAIELIGIDTGAADIVELHETTKDENGVASMAPVGGLQVQPEESLAFGPGGKHAMLIGVRDGLAEGASATLTLHFNDGSTVTVEAPVRAQAGAEPHQH